jgi:hypothetical protein
VLELFEDAELGLQLFLFFLGHFLVADLLSAEDLGVLGQSPQKINVRIRPTCGGPC